MHSQSDFGYAVPQVEARTAQRCIDGARYCHRQLMNMMHGWSPANRARYAYEWREMRQAWLSEARTYFDFERRAATKRERKLRAA